MVSQCAITGKAVSGVRVHELTPFSKSVKTSRKKKSVQKNDHQLLYSTLCRAQDPACTNSYPLQKKFNIHIREYMHDKKKNNKFKIKTKQTKNDILIKLPTDQSHKKQINPRKYFVNTLNRLFNIRHPANKLFKQATSYNQ